MTLLFRFFQPPKMTDDLAGGRWEEWRLGKDSASLDVHCHCHHEDDDGGNTTVNNSIMVVVIYTYNRTNCC